MGPEIKKLSKILCKSQIGIMPSNKNMQSRILIYFEIENTLRLFAAVLQETDPFQVDIESYRMFLTLVSLGIQLKLLYYPKIRNY